MANKLEPKYRSRLRQLEHLNRPAFRFLTRLDEEGPAHGLRLSTSTHAHVYRDSSYLMRIELESRGRDPASIVLSDKPHIQIAQDATDRTDLLFPKLITALVMKHSGYKAGWAPRGASPQIELTPSTPDAFFDALYEWLSTVEIAD